MSKKVNVTALVAGLVVSIVLLLYSILYFEGLMGIIFSIIGLGLIFYNLITLIPLTRLVGENKIYYLDLALSVLGIIFGTMLIFDQGFVTEIIVLVYLVIMPIYRIIKANDHIRQLKRESPLLICAALIALNLFHILLQIIFIILSSLLIIYLVIELIKAIAKSDNFDSNSNDNDNLVTPAYDSNDSNVDNEKIIDAEYEDLDQ